MVNQNFSVKKLIAKRLPPGDNWELLNSPKAESVYSSLTDVLEAYWEHFQKNEDYLLKPLLGEVWVTGEEFVPSPVETPEPVYGLYGDKFKQGI